MQNVKTLWFVVCCVMSVFCLNSVGFVSQADAYSFLRKGENNRAMAWKRSRFPISIVLDSAGSPDIKLDTLESILKLSVDTWNGVDCAAAKLKYSGVVRGKTAPFTDDVNMIKFVQTPAEWAREWTPQQFAVTVVTALIRTGEILDADMLMNDWNFKFGTTQIPNEADLQATLTHELGHVLGIGHSTDPAASMDGSANIGETNKRKLNDDDRRALCDLYPIQPCKENDEQADTVCYNGRFYPICAPYQQACLPCVSDLDCFGDANFCVGGVCGVACGPTLRACESGYLCRNVQDQNGQPIGQNCVPNAECSTLKKYPCCRTDDDCMPNYSCQQNSCVRGNVCRILADTCSEQQTCCPGMSCVNDGTGARCRQPCDPLSPQCPRGSRCGLAGETDGFCVPPNGGGQDGDECNDSSKKCEHELHCDPKDSRCRYLCRPGPQNSCPAGYACKSLALTKLGLCYQGGRDCKISDECPQGQVCQNNLCRPCSGDAECPPRYKCVENLCQGPCTTNADCPRQQYCDNNICRPGVPCTEDATCSGGFICTNGICQSPSQGSCKSDADCSSGKVCANSVCQSPNTCNNKCAATERCLKGLCVPNTCASDGQCGPGFKCRNGECQKDDAADCGGKGPCPAGKECINNRCVSQLGAACVGDEDCVPGLTCVKGATLKRCSKICSIASDCPAMFDKTATSCIKLSGIGMGCWPNSELECENGDCKLKGAGCGGCSTQGEPPPTGSFLFLLLLMGWQLWRQRKSMLTKASARSSS